MRELHLIAASIVSLFGFAILPVWAALPVQALTCPDASEEIISDRPDISTSAIVVPKGSLQVGNGFDWTSGQGSHVVHFPETVLRGGVAHCTEATLSLPSYSTAVRGPAQSGFSDVQMTLKRQLVTLPGKMDVSGVLGLGFPVGHNTGSCGGYNSFVELPWRKPFDKNWTVNGMVKLSWYNGLSNCNPTLEPTFALSRRLGWRISLFTEYVGEFEQHDPPSQFVNAGGIYRLTRTQLFWFRFGFGFTKAAPDQFFGLGYTFRLDDVFPTH
jgi:Putative MetA-pathway of phenol degradation